MSEETKDKKTVEEMTAEKRCFVMMPFSDQGDYPKGHFTKVYEQIFMPAIKKAGYTPYRVDENTISDSIIDKIFEGVQNCEMALCDLSNRNPNVLYELGLRQAYNKPVVLVKDEKTPNIFDVSIISTVPYNSNRLYENVLEAQEKICESLKSTGDGNDTTLIQFVRAREASYSDIKVNKNDTTNIMLQSIMKELQRLNSSNEIGSRESDYVEISVFIKSTMNQKEIEEIIKAYLSTTNTRIVNINKTGGIATLIIPDNEYFKHRKQINDIIEAKIGRIMSIYKFGQSM